MSTAEADEVSEVLNRVKNWSASLRMALARRIMESLDTSAVVERGTGSPTETTTRGVPVESVVGLLRTDCEPPGDVECRQIVEEKRWKKHGS